MIKLPFPLLDLWASILSRNDLVRDGTNRYIVPETRVSLRLMRLVVPTHGDYTHRKVSELLATIDSDNYPNSVIDIELCRELIAYICLYQVLDPNKEALKIESGVLHMGWTSAIITRVVLHDESFRIALPAVHSTMIRELKYRISERGNSGHTVRAINGWAHRLSNKKEMREALRRLEGQ